MKFKNLGRSGLSVSRICLGTMNFGPETDEATSHSIMDSAIANGVNFFDTANRYGGVNQWGRTEEIIGRWFARGGQRREKIVLATKLYGETDSWPNNKGVSVTGEAKGKFSTSAAATLAAGIWHKRRSKRHHVISWVSYPSNPYTTFLGAT